MAGGLPGFLIGEGDSLRLWPLAPTRKKSKQPSLLIEREIRVLPYRRAVIDAYHINHRFRIYPQIAGLAGEAFRPPARPRGNLMLEIFCNRIKCKTIDDFIACGRLERSPRREPYLLI